MTTDRRDDTEETPFGRWLRAQPELDSVKSSTSATDCDMWVHKFKVRDEKGAVQPIDHIMLVEVKTFSKGVAFAQRDTLNVVNRILREAGTRKTDGARIALPIPDDRENRIGMIRRVRVFGVHVLSMSGDTPDNSDVIHWDGFCIQKDHLIAILRFDRDPDDPRLLFNTRRHHKRPARELHPDLFRILEKANTKK